MSTSLTSVGGEAGGVDAAGIATRATTADMLADYAALTKPRIAILALTTVTAGYALGSGDGWQVVQLLHALLGIALVAAGSSALNQYVERVSDTRMRRTATRPLPAGRMLPREALAFGLVVGLAGSLYLALFVNVPTAALAAATLVLYAGVYTPLKPVSGLATAVGAVPGAMPPVLGWAASGAPFDIRAFSLFAILFLWQFPHFLAIGWMYRDEYARAGLKMLPAGGASPRIVGLLAVAYAVALIPLSLLPARLGLAGGLYLLVALGLGLAYAAAALRFAVGETLPAARRLLWTSLVYLPLLYSALVWDHFRLLSY